MDERKEILQDTIDRLIETALQELDQKLPEAGGEAALSHISDQIRQDAQLDEQQTDAGLYPAIESGYLPPVQTPLPPGSIGLCPASARVGGDPVTTE